jgi:hypothetical protein
VPKNQRNSVSGLGTQKRGSISASRSSSDPIANAQPTEDEAAARIQSVVRGALVRKQSRSKLMEARANRMESIKAKENLGGSKPSS